MPPEEVSKKIQDALATNEKVREGLSTDDALPLMDWGNSYADVLAATLTAPEAPEPDEEQVNNTAYSLVRLMMRMTWLVTYRDQKDETWLTQTFQMVNKLSQDLLGEKAPVFSDEEIAAWIAGHSTRTNNELIRDFMARLAPSAMAAPEPPAGSPAEPLAPSEPAPPVSPLSDWVFGAARPGKHDAGAASSESDSPLQSGEGNND
jgi:hypothetical protein